MISETITVVWSSLSIFVLFFIPGFALTLIFYPQSGQLHGSERIALSMGLSVAVLILIGYILNTSPWPINRESILLTIFSIFAIGYWNVTRYKTNSLFNNLHIKSPLTTLLAISLCCITIFSVSWLAIRSQSTREPTEFYISERSLDADELLLRVGVINHEDIQGTFIVEVSSALSNELSMGEQLIARYENIQIVQDEKWEQELRVNLPEMILEGKGQILIRLFKNTENEPFRSLHMWL